MTRQIATATTFLLALALASAASAADWPMYCADANRSAYTSEPLPTSLREVWSYAPRHAPAPAWPRSERMTFDWAPQPVCARGLVLLGDSADGKVRALDLVSGRIRWKFFTAGPVRFAPAVWKDTAFVASDDGFLYALSVADGSLRWRFQAAPARDLVLSGDAGSALAEAVVIAVRIADGASLETTANAGGGWEIELATLPGDLFDVYQLVDGALSAAISVEAPGTDPNNPEICNNGLDDDHDGLVDETECLGAACASEADCDPTAPICVNGHCAVGDDADGDGWPAGVDCNDNDANVGPGMPEIPGNGVDDDCDGMIDEA